MSDAQWLRFLKAGEALQSDPDLFLSAICLLEELATEPPVRRPTRIDWRATSQGTSGKSCPGPQGCCCSDFGDGGDHRGSPDA